MEKIKLRRKRKLGFTAAKKLFAAMKRFVMGKTIVPHGKEEAG